MLVSKGDILFPQHTVIWLSDLNVPVGFGFTLEGMTAYELEFKDLYLEYYCWYVFYLFIFNYFVFIEMNLSFQCNIIAVFFMAIKKE